MAAPTNLEIARRTIERWNANDLDGVLEFYAADAVMLAGPDWPEQTEWEGRDAIRRNMEEWRDVWESSVIEVEDLDSIGERVVGTGAWNTRGRVSGVDGTLPFAVILSFSGGMIVTHEWFTDRDGALAAARSA